MANVAKIAGDGSSPRRAKIPRASELPDAPRPLEYVEPSGVVLSKLGKHIMAMGVDIETADWIPGKHALHKGQFGFHTMCADIDFDQRIVQVGWSIREVSRDSLIEEEGEVIVRPDGFEIAKKAADLHGITTQRAMAEGLPLATVMDQFMTVMHRTHKRGGCVVIHNLEFDAGIVDKELVTAGLEHWRPVWHVIAKEGFCTMDPDIGKWIQMCRGRVRDASQDSNAVMSLTNIINDMATMLPMNEVQEFRKNKIHTAGEDAHMHCLIYTALRKLSASAEVPASDLHGV